MKTPSKKILKFFLFFIAFLIAPEIFAAPDLKINNAWIASTEEGDDMSVAYMSLLSSEDIILTSITSPTIKTDRKSTRLNSSHIPLSRMPSSA